MALMEDYKGTYPLIGDEIEYKTGDFQLELHRAEFEAQHIVFDQFSLEEFLLLAPSTTVTIRPPAPWATALPTMQSALNVACRNTACDIPAFVLGRTSDGVLSTADAFTGRTLGERKFFLEHFQETTEGPTRLSNGMRLATPLSPTQLWRSVAQFCSVAPNAVVGRETLTVTCRKSGWSGSWRQGMPQWSGGPVADPVEALSVDLVWPRARAGSFDSFTVSPVEAPVWTASLVPRVGEPLTLHGRLVSMARILAASLRSTGTDIFPEEFEVTSPGCVDPLRASSSFGLKADPRGSLLQRVALKAADDGSLKHAAGLWRGMVQWMSAHWAERELMPLVGADPPNMAHGLVFQRLAMVNVAIAEYNRNPARYEGVDRAPAEEDLPPVPEQNAEGDSKGLDNWGDDDLDLSDSDSDAEFEAFDNEPTELPPPRGVLAPMPGTFLLAFPALPLNVPLTQPTPPMSEEKLRVHEEVLIGLAGSDSEVRDRYHSAQLLSDMRAFKAANPAAALEDFIRWYSPNDWVPAQPEHNVDIALDVELPPELKAAGVTEATVKNARRVIGYQLSPRMAAPTGLWRVLWSSADPVAADEQAPLFDAIGEAETTLVALETMPFCSVCFELFWTLLEYSLTVLDAAHKVIPPVVTRFDELKAFVRQKARGIADGPEYNKDMALVDEILPVVAEVELKTSLVASLYTKLDASEESTRDLIHSLVSTGSAFVEEESRGNVAQALGKAIERPQLFQLMGEAEKPALTFGYSLATARRSHRLSMVIDGEFE
ncbi:rab3 GTPase-activating protein catalytic subunit isoform X2 [Carpediemonas membranifera]|uniref:Rab3 GTPase-activating protein catalytic subunit n=1 Tax=Carpediemonas membranifera TaxID=201153 RepID=A0A8J6AXU5_9EUKA|nr:rab3 GTPase-activating protein catalytic subunit isoform X2 [Carpediemonas membranifera]|eukprot:KAG9395135.1 rab3 GTPase-activating protein catalytic subunit isoform X2 [Carpediemonas membranifera]